MESGAGLLCAGRPSSSSTMYFCYAVLHYKIKPPQDSGVLGEYVFNIHNQVTMSRCHRQDIVHCNSMDTPAATPPKTKRKQNTARRHPEASLEFGLHA
jgi:hypothetical protein